MAIWKSLELKTGVISQLLDGKEKKFDHQKVSKELTDIKIDGFVKGMMEVVKCYEERKALYEEEINRIEKRRMSFDQIPTENEELGKEIDLLDDFDGESDIQKSLSRFAQFEFHKK